MPPAPAGEAIAPLEYDPGADEPVPTPEVGLRRPVAIDRDARVRGFNAAQANASVNGVNQLRSRLDLDYPFGQVDPGLVGGVTMIDGPYSSLFGPGFAFLVADLRAPQRFESPHGGQRSVLGYESNGSQVFWRQDAQAGGRTWGFLGSFGQRVGNDYTPGGDLFRIPASYNQWDGYAAFSLDVAPGRTLDLFYLHNELNNVELPGVAYDLRQSSNHQVNLRYTFWEGEERRERLVFQTWATRTRYRGDNAAPSKQATFFAHLTGVPFGPYSRPTPGALAGLLVNGGLSTYGARSYLKFGDPERLELTVGADARLEQFFQREADFDPAGVAAFGGDIFGVPRSSAASVGGFAHLTGSLAPALTITTGGRFDAWQAGFDGDDPVRTAGESASPGSAFLSQPRHFLGMGYLMLDRRLDEFVSLTTGAAYAMRPPTLAELYADRPWTPLVRFGNSIAIGDSDLKPERLAQFDVGVRGEWPGLSAGVRGYVASVNDYLLYRPLPFSNTPKGSVQGDGPSQLGRQVGSVAATDDASVAYQYVSLARATLLGGEATAEWRLRPWCLAFGSLAYVRGVNDDPLVLQADGTYTRERSEGLPGIAPLTGVVGLRVFEPTAERYGVELNGRLVAPQHRVAESLGELGTPGYTVWNLRGWVKLGGRVTLASAVRNLFNSDYTRHGSLAIADPRSGSIFFVPEPGVSWVTSVEVNY